MNETKLISNEELIQAYKDKLNLLERIIEVKDLKIEVLEQQIELLQRTLGKLGY